MSNEEIGKYITIKIDIVSSRYRHKHVNRHYSFLI